MPSIKAQIRSSVKSVTKTAITYVGTFVARITGSKVVGQTLAIVLGSGVTATGYQWKRDAVDISGATSSTYTLVEADEGALISCYVSGPDYLAGPTYIPDSNFFLAIGSDRITIGGDYVYVGVPA